MQTAAGCHPGVFLHRIDLLQWGRRGKPSCSFHENLRYCLSLLFHLLRGRRGRQRGRTPGRSALRGLRQRLGVVAGATPAGLPTRDADRAQILAHAGRASSSRLNVCASIRNLFPPWT